MTERKAFYEIEQPARTKDLVLIARWIDVPVQKDETLPLTGLCTAMVGNGYCHLATSWQCFICNQWTCDLHESKKKTYQGGAICESCAELTPEEQDDILNLWRELSR